MSTWSSGRIALMFLVVVLASGVAFWLLSGTKYGGVVATIETIPEPDFFDCMYFSVVTVSSLGYGDYRPVGLGRILAMIEVLAGLCLLALLIARVTGDRQATHVEQLLMNDQDRRFRERSLWWTERTDEGRRLLADQSADVAACQGLIIRCARTARSTLGHLRALQHEGLLIDRSGGSAARLVKHMASCLGQVDQLPDGGKTSVQSHRTRLQRDFIAIGELIGKHYAHPEAQRLGSLVKRESK